ncbi:MULTISPECIES: hypothetical protein [Paenibacillus]|uniref:hypothetical protein n=1 Tax=Paenibacillus TaxID=44249 RepID=UPI000471B2A1|nr:hypothetical protein [Paenibacillus massiliensis]
MRLYSNRAVQIFITLLYPIIAFVILSNGRMIGSWIIPAIIAFLFCLLWRNIGYLMISNVLLWIITIPLWWLLVERSRESQGADIFIASLPFIVLAYVFFVLLPEIIIVSLRNSILSTFARRGDK